MPVQEQLRDALSKNAVRVIDLFRDWDENGDGRVSKKEFRKAVATFLKGASKADVDKLFDSFDPEGAGDIDYNKYNTDVETIHLHDDDNDHNLH